MGRRRPFVLAGTILTGSSLIKSRVQPASLGRFLSLPRSVPNARLDLFG